MYLDLGEAKVDMERINDFISLANDFKIMGLTPVTEQTTFNEESRSNSDNLLENINDARLITDEEMGDHTKINHRQIICNMCDFACTSKSEMKDHIETEHTHGLSNFKCPCCDYASNTQVTLAEHMIRFEHFASDNHNSTAQLKITSSFDKEK